MDKVYIVTSGEYSDYHIDAVFLNEEKAKAYCSCHKNCEIEDWNLSDNDTYTTFNTVLIEYYIFLDERQSKKTYFNFEKAAIEDASYKDNNEIYANVYNNHMSIILRRKLPNTYDKAAIQRKYTKAFYDLQAEIKYMLSLQDTSTYEKRREAENNILEAIKDKFGIERE